MFRSAAALSVVITILIVSAAAAETPEAPLPSGPELLAGLTADHLGPRSYSADLAADFHERSFPFVHIRLNGTVYYRAPDRYAVVFKDAPGIMKGLADGYATMMNVGSWSRHFSAATLPDRTAGGRTEHVLRLTGLDPQGALHHGDIFIDPATNEIAAMDWHMSGGMVFSIRQDYAQMPEGFDLVSTQHGMFRVPFANGSTMLTLSNYHCNIEIADDVFALTEEAGR
jgi:hypothetical protein